MLCATGPCVGGQFCPSFFNKVDYCMLVLARLKPNLAPLGARFIPYKTLVYLNVWEIKVE